MGGRHTGRTQIRPFVTEHLAREVRVDLTKKQVAHNGVSWTIRAPAGESTAEGTEGVAEAVFRGRRITSLRLGTRT
jgi:NTE family protein